MLRRILARITGSTCVDPWCAQRGSCDHGGIVRRAGRARTIGRMDYTDSPSPTTSPDSVDAPLGYDGGTTLDVGGSGMSKATEPADPMNFVPAHLTEPYPSPNPIGDSAAGENPQANASWGYPDHGEQITNP